MNSRISISGHIVEVTEDAYWYFLEILPPKHRPRHRAGRPAQPSLGNDLFLGRDRPEVALGSTRHRSTARTGLPFRHGRPLWNDHVPDSQEVVATEVGQGCVTGNYSALADYRERG